MHYAVFERITHSVFWYISAMELIGGGILFLAFVFGVCFIWMGLAKAKDKITGSDDFNEAKYNDNPQFRDVIYIWLSAAIIIGAFILFCAIFVW